MNLELSELVKEISKKVSISRPFNHTYKNPWKIQKTELCSATQSMYEITHTAWNDVLYPGPVEVITS